MLQAVQTEQQAPPPMIRVERDIDGVRTALIALFEESFQRAAIDDAVRTADKETREQMLEEMPERELSPGYYAQAHYLLDLANAIEAGVSYGAGSLTRTDVLGLMAVSRARAEFESNHPKCNNCGARQDSKFAPACKKCHTKFGGA